MYTTCPWNRLGRSSPIIHQRHANNNQIVKLTILLFLYTSHLVVGYISSFYILNADPIRFLYTHYTVMHQLGIRISHMKVNPMRVS
ncbi:hypothetical protein OUZ56_016001 [Daphnia magna]|uniref:Uncharacterized protein n=1 Tax=Daphnia magna TaxID=35525 RepID=A0ABR0APK0_9CRUS|nr:hypothetical protein OUZ56_016001 [Daphnia magna]